MTKFTFTNHAASQAEEWINAIQEELKLPHKQSGYAALRAVLHTLRNRLPVKENADIAAQMPTLVRGIYFEGWSPKPHQKLARTPKAFEDEVTELLGNHKEINANEAIRAVFAFLDTRVSHGEMNDVIGNFPVDMRIFWPTAAVERLGMNTGR